MSADSITNINNNNKNINNKKQARNIIKHNHRNSDKSCLLLVWHDLELFSSYPQASHIAKKSFKKTMNQSKI